MIEFLLFFIAGAVGGILGGMGMGGGTLLIPILTFFFGISQKLAQAINLLSFIPMAIIALILHAKNHLVKMKGMALLTVFAAGLSVAGSLIVQNIQGNLQTKFFGAFLTVLAIVKGIITFKKEKADKKA